MPAKKQKKTNSCAKNFKAKYLLLLCLCVSMKYLLSLQLAINYGGLGFSLLRRNDWSRWDFLTHTLESSNHDNERRLNTISFPNNFPISDRQMKYSWAIKQKGNRKYWPHLNYPGSRSLHHSGIERRCSLRQRRQILYGYMWPALYWKNHKSHGRRAKLRIFPVEQTVNIPPLMILPAPHSVFTI